jgi:hypothetical protein
MGLAVVAPLLGEIPRLRKAGGSSWLAERTAEALAAGMAWVTRQGVGASLRRAPRRHLTARQVLGAF